jgi:hypothetical protein
MAKRSIRTIEGIRRAADIQKRRRLRLYSRPYVLQEAIARNLARFESVRRIEDPDERFAAFKAIPALEFDAEGVDSELSPAQRLSLAQQDRARRPRARLSASDITLLSIIVGVLERFGARHPRAKELWIPAIDELRTLGLNPTLVDQEQEAIEYDFRGGRRTLSAGHFANLVTKAKRRFDN